jgi:hypothetical protein
MVTAIGSTTAASRAARRLETRPEMLGADLEGRAQVPARELDRFASVVERGTVPAPAETGLSASDRAWLTWSGSGAGTRSSAPIGPVPDERVASGLAHPLRTRA